MYTNSLTSALDGGE